MTGTVPVNKKLLTGSVPVNNLFLTFFIGIKYAPALGMFTVYLYVYITLTSCVHITTYYTLSYSPVSTVYSTTKSTVSVVQNILVITTVRYSRVLPGDILGT